MEILTDDLRALRERFTRRPRRPVAPACCRAARGLRIWSTEWVGDDVEIRFDLKLTPAR